MLVFVFLFTFIYLPETHGRSVEEIQRMVGAGDDEVRTLFLDANADI